MLKWKRTKESGSQAPAPEERSKRGSPVEQLWERNRVGRKETNRKLSTRTVKEGTRDQAGGNGENRKARAERSTVKATVRQKQEDKGKEETEAE